MLSFRKKVIFGDIILLVILILLVLPFVGKTVNNIVKSSLQDTVDELIVEAMMAKNVDDLVSRFEGREKFNFYRITLVDDKGKIIYDSHIENDISNDLKDAVEITDAISKGQGYHERTSKAFLQSFAFVAKSFEFKGEKLVVRAAFPLKQIGELREDLEFGFLVFAILLLVAYVVMAYFLVHRFSYPIRHIIEVINPYLTKKTDNPPHIDIDKMMSQTEEFQKLALTLNLLSERIHNQIDSLTLQRNENEAILQSLIEGVIACDNNGIITYVNDVSCQMLLIAKEELLGKVCETLHHEGSLFKLCQKQIKKCQKEGKILKESIMVEEGQKIYLDVIASPMLNKKGAILILQDKTADHRVLQMGRDFIANASHELRTPITVIKGFAETLLDHPNMDREMLKNISEKIVKTSNKLNDLVNGLLTLSDVESVTTSRFVECDLEEILDNCAHMIMCAHPEAKINFVKDKEKSIVRGDASLLERAFMNLLDNAIKYAKDKAEISIKISRGEDRVSVAVADNGIGIAEEERVRIFERFYRVDKARSSKISGLGLGLSIVKTIVDKHLGEITVSSSDKGSCFTITLPIIYEKESTII
jgi:PAS domain S-box-containing protein